MTEGNEQGIKLLNGEESVGIRENDRIFSVLERIESEYTGRHLIVGGIGVQGALGKEYRISHDIDVCVPIEEETKIVSFMEEIGFTQKNENTRLLGSGAVLSNGEFVVDIVGGEFTEKGLTLKMSSGELFVPKDGLNNEVSLRGISFTTFTPEVHYLLKNRMVDRNPFHTVYIFAKRKQDENDYRELEKIVDLRKTKELVANGFSYTGRHPIIDKIFG
jgi:hypothetical protein